MLSAAKQIIRPKAMHRTKQREVYLISFSIPPHNSKTIAYSPLKKMTKPRFERVKLGFD